MNSLPSSISISIFYKEENKNALTVDDPLFLDNSSSSSITSSRYPSLSHIPLLFSDKTENSLLSVSENRPLTFSVSDESFPYQTKLIIDCFKEIIGEKRLIRIGKKAEIGIDFQTLQITKEVVRKIFVGLLDIQKDDLMDIESNESIDTKFRQLIPYSSLKEVEASLMGIKPTLSESNIDNAQTSGKGFEGLLETIHICMHHHFKVIEETNEKAAELRDIELLTSRLSDREVRLGRLIHLKEGYFYVDQIIHGGGAYLYVLKDIEEVKTPKIVFRGTAMRKNATEAFQSGLNDILPEIGTKGVITIWPELSLYLKKNNIQSVEILGKSLGGAHAQELAILIEATTTITVKKLTTFGSVGIGKNLNQLFKKEILEKRATPFHIQVIRSGGPSVEHVDFVPVIGGVHLGEDANPEKCHVEICYLQPGESATTLFPKEVSTYNLTKYLMYSLGVTHCRQNTLNRFTWKTIDDRKQINEHLRMGEQLETIRRRFGYFVQGDHPNSTESQIILRLSQERAKKELSAHLNPCMPSFQGQLHKSDRTYAIVPFRTPQALRPGL